MKTWERGVIFAARSIVFLALISSLMYGKLDQIVAALAGFISLFVPSFVRWIYSHPSKRVWPWVSPFYNDGVYTLFAIFMAFHITFLNVPFLHLDLYNQVWGYADVPSHLLGGLVTWVIFNEVVLETSRMYNQDWSTKKIVWISFFALTLVGVTWEFLEVLMQPDMPWLYETVANKTQDVIMEIVGFLIGIILVYRFKYPYSLYDPLKKSWPPGITGNPEGTFSGVK